MSRPLWRTVESVRLRPRDEGAEIEVHAPSFVWGMVRKIVGALREVDQGRLPLDRLSSAIAGKERLTLPLAEPEGLVLWDVQYPAIVWETHWRGANRHQASHWRDTRRALWSRTEVLACITGEADLSAPGTRVG